MDQGFEGVAGGIAGLRRLLTEHGGAVERDLLCEGLRLDHLGTERLTWRDLLVFVEHSPATSALGRATDPDWWITPEVQMLREVHQEVRVLQWLQTEDARKPQHQNFPTRLPLTAAEVAAEKAKNAPEYEALPVDEMADFLGWSRPTPKEA